MLDDTHLSQLEAAELIHVAQIEPEIEYIFRHALIQDAAYQTLRRRDRKQIHLKVAQALEELYPERIEEYAPLLAQHYLEAEAYRPALRYFMQAADSAVGKYANSEAIQHYQQAIEIARQLGDTAALSPLYLRFGRTCEISTRYEEAMQGYAEMIAFARTHQDQRMELAGLMAQATLYSTQNPLHHPAKGHETLEQARTLAHALNDKAAEAKILWSLMLLEFFGGGDFQYAIRCGEESLEIARAHNLREQMAFTMHDLALGCMGTGQHQRGKQYRLEVLELWRELGNQPMLVDALGGLPFFTFALGEWDQALAFADEAYQLSVAINNLWGQGSSHQFSGSIYAERGELGKAIAIMERSIVAGDAAGVGMVQIGVRAELGWLYGFVGVYEKALSIAAEALKFAQHFGPVEPWAQGALGEIYLMADDVEQAEQAALTGRAAFGPGSLLLSDIRSGLLSGKVALAKGNYEEAINLVDELIKRDRTTWCATFLLPDALLVKGRALMALGRTQLAEATLQQSREQAEQVGAQRSLWSVLVALGELYLGQSERQNEANALFAEARSIVEKMAATLTDPGLQTSFLAQPSIQKLFNQSLT